jgi:DNA-binding IclR family transcriptional regulator
MGTNSDSRRPKTTLQTAQRALRFLEFVAQQPQPPQLKSVATALGINITTCYHLFNTLHAAGYVSRDADGAVRLGGQVAVLYSGLVRQVAAGRELQPILAELSAQTHETAYLAGLSAESVVIQAVVESGHAVRVTGLHVGFGGAEHVRASGKAVLAHLDDAARDRILDASMRELEPAARARVLRSLEPELLEIRSQGWAFDDQYFADTVCCVAAPYFDAAGDVAGSIAVSVPAGRFVDNRQTLITRVVAAAGEASSRLGYQLTSAG